MVSLKIEERAQEVLDEIGIKSVPVEVEKIAKYLEIQIRKGPSDDFSGILFRKANQSFIGINSKESKVRQRFTIAHELGHYFLHQDKSVFIEYRDNKPGITRKPKELEANAFAAALLMPKSLIEKDLEQIMKKGALDEMDIKLLSGKYDVSDDAMKMRLINLSYLTAIN